MHGHSTRRRGDRGGLLTVLLALALAVRVISAPFVFASPAPGVMAICSGGQIIYVSMEDGQPVENEAGESSAACPYFGVMSALPGAVTPMPAYVALTRPAEVPTDTSLAPRLDRQEAYQPRAPPSLI